MKKRWRREEQEIILRISQLGAESPSQVIHLLRRLKGTAAIFLFEWHIHTGFSSSLPFCRTPNWRFRLEASLRLLTGVGLIDGFESGDLDKMARGLWPRLRG